MQIRIFLALALSFASVTSLWAEEESTPGWLTDYRGQRAVRSVLDSPSDRENAAAEENPQQMSSARMAPDAATPSASGCCGACGCNSCGDQCCNNGSCGNSCCNNGCGSNMCCGSCCRCDCLGNWLDNTQVWLGADAYKSIGDAGLGNFNPLPFAVGNSFGTVGGLNTAFGLGGSRIRAQVGGSYGLYDFPGRTIGNARELETQCFLTAGIYKRSNICCGDRIAWGVVYDQFFANNWGWAANPVYLGQFRGIVGYALNECNEVGVWGTVYTNTDTAFFTFPGAGPLRIHATNQLNGFWRHNWELGASTMVYAGVADQGNTARFVTGLIGQMPLNDCWSAYGNCTYVTSQGPLGPVAAAQEQWNIGFGLMYSFGGKARSWNVSGQQGLPLLPVANNGTFLITQQ